ncbi:MAG: hypothetical protein QW103_02415 [Candidatus Pacearchaeota archaeon]
MGDVDVFIKRILSFFDEIKEIDKNILIVAYGGVNLSLLAISTGSRKKGAKLIQKFNKQDNTCVNVIEKINGKFKIKKITARGI